MSLKLEPRLLYPRSANRRAHKDKDPALASAVELAGNGVVQCVPRWNGKINFTPPWNLATFSEITSAATGSGKGIAGLKKKMKEYYDDDDNHENERILAWRTDSALFGHIYR